MFTAALFTIARTWKQPRCPSADEWKNGNNNPICKTAKETQIQRTDFWTLWEKVREG